jgi:uncharacterized DUF497 family protein
MPRKSERNLAKHGIDFVAAQVEEVSLYES